MALGEDELMNQKNAKHVHLQDLNLVLTMPADGWYMVPVDDLIGTLCPKVAQNLVSTPSMDN